MIGSQFRAPLTRRQARRWWHPPRAGDGVRCRAVI